MQETLIRLFREHFGVPPAGILDLAGDASTRLYRRLIGPAGETAIGALGPDHEENRAFLSFTRAFRAAGFPVPDLYGSDEEAGAYLLEDLGDTTLFDALEHGRRQLGGRFPDDIGDVYRQVVDWLPRFQVEGDGLVDYSVAYPRQAFDRQSILWDLNYFKYHFLKLAHVPFNEDRLEADFQTLTEYLLEAESGYFLYRDFQSRNVMLRDGKPWFIDYQGGRRGALHYDLASLLLDAKADLPEDLRRELFDRYLTALDRLVPVDPERFRDLYSGYALIRILQALGAYGYRGFFERKPHFLRSVPYAARNVASLLGHGLPIRAPELEGALHSIVRAWGARPDTPEPADGLTVHIHSFSFARGYPEDVGGHGGGFVFDCRAIPNPGRDARFAALTGRDTAVVEHIQRFPETERFWASACDLIDAQVDDYVVRGFDSLTVAFGCTGGQHRSVYFAERLARHLAARSPGVGVRLCHREEPRWPRPEALTWMR